jgi:peptide/nickel transport system ATP-binding protein
MRSREPLLVCENLSISYLTRAGEVPAVIHFDLEVMPGEAHGIVGESGCGKSTVAFAIMRYLGRNGRIVGGSIRYKGRELTTMPPAQLQALRGSEIAMVYQEPMASLNPAMTIGRQLAEVPRFHEGASERVALARAEAMLDAVKLPDPARILGSYPHQLSGGQQQRVGIAMALLGNPSLLLLDEPTTALDVTVEAGIVDLIGEIAGRFGTSLVFISHNLGLILATCERMTVMYAGEAVEVGTVEDVFDAMRHPYTRGLLSSVPLLDADKNARPLEPIPGQPPLPNERPPGCNFGPRCAWFEAGTCDHGLIEIDLVSAEARHLVRCRRFAEIDWEAAKPGRRPSSGIELGRTVLEVRGLRKHYELEERTVAALIRGGKARLVRANEQIELEAREAETVAIVGESGCGKSTLAKMLIGLETATGGKALLQGRDIASTPVQKRLPQTLRFLQMVFQNPSDTLNPSHTVGRQIARVVRKFGIERDRRKARERVFELLDLVKLPREFYGRKPRQLSGGQKQRVGIARAFAGNPKLVVADEPVSALDVSVRAAITQLLMDIQRQNRTTLLFISHDLALVRYLADRVVVMYLGHVVEKGAVGEVFRPPYHPYTEALLSAVPVPDTRVKRKRILLEGEIPSAIDPPSGCPFHTRCHRKIGPICEREAPPVRRFGTGHTIACHIPPAELEAIDPVIRYGTHALPKEPAPAG